MHATPQRVMDCLRAASRLSPVLLNQQTLAEFLNALFRARSGHSDWLASADKVTIPGCLNHQSVNLSRAVTAPCDWSPRSPCSPETPRSFDGRISAIFTSLGLVPDLLFHRLAWSSTWLDFG